MAIGVVQGAVGLGIRPQLLQGYFSTCNVLPKTDLRCDPHRSANFHDVFFRPTKGN